MEALFLPLTVNGAANVVAAFEDFAAGRGWASWRPSMLYAFDNEKDAVARLLDGRLPLEACAMISISGSPALFA